MPAKQIVAVVVIAAYGGLRQRAAIEQTLPGVVKWVPLSVSAVWIL